MLASRDPLLWISLAMLTQAAILCRKAELAIEQQQLQAVLDAGIQSGMDPLDQPDIPQDIKVCLIDCSLITNTHEALHLDDQPVEQRVLLSLSEGQVGTVDLCRL